MPKIGSFEYQDISDLFPTRPDDENKLLDLRNFDWSRDEIRPRYYGGHILNCDFSHSVSEKGFLVRDGIFENVSLITAHGGFLNSQIANSLIVVLITVVFFRAA